MGREQLQQIAERCQQGDHEAFALLYTAMRQPLRAVCLNYVHDETVADDLLHDAFLLIFFQIGKLKDASRAEAWMTMLMRRVSLLYLRKQRQQRQETLSSCSSWKSLTVENGAESSLAVQEVLAAVDALPEGYRNVFRLFVIDGMSHQEIAAMLHIEPNSASSQLYHAKALLRRWLRPMVLLLAVALPLGVDIRQTVGTDFMAVCNSQAPSAKKGSGIMAVSNTRPLPSLEEQHEADSNSCQTQEWRDENNKCETMVDSGGQTQERTDTNGVADWRLVVDNGDSMSEIVHPDKGNDWALAVTYSGVGNGGEMRLPYADAETNPMVYDSIAHHHRPLTVSLMLNRKLGNHWQVGAGLSYERMTSDMLSGNTYVALSQHQVVRYIGVPVSVSWHHPIGHRFSTYLSASFSVSLPLYSKMESVWLLDGRSYEPTSERLHPAVQWSGGVGLGLQYNLTPHVGFFVEPGLRYHFNGSDDKVKTWNTEHPLDFSVPLGLRITF